MMGIEMAKKQSRNAPLIQKIVVAVDFSPASDRAFEYAARLAESQNAEVLAVFVKDADNLAIALRQNMEVRHDEVPHLNRKLAALLQKNYETLSARVTPRCPVRFAVLSGNPAQEVVKLAGAEKADLIVSGTRGRSRISNLLLGSTARDLIVLSTCPVLTLNERK
jgi:universal stress protein A